MISESVAPLSASQQTYQECSRCVMDTSAKFIEFDENGVCDYCRNFEASLAKSPLIDPIERENALQELVAKVKQDGKGKPYDCIVGVSGGVDSTYTIVKVKELGLRPLAVHMDNGWDSELAANNIAQVIKKLGVDLYTHVIDWEEYKDLMQAFFDADVIDIELLYDNAMLAVNYDMAEKYNLHYILAGSNTSTEGLAMPNEWSWFKYDVANIWAIHKKFGKLQTIKTFPAFSFRRFLWVYHFKKRANRELKKIGLDVLKHIDWTCLLDYVGYNKPEALQYLASEFAFKPYPYKHYENIFTRFYQGYILPNKFGVDKRRNHFSSLIVSGQMTREDALKDLQKIPYSDEQTLQQDINYFLKKMGWTKTQLDEYISRPPKNHAQYGSEKWLHFLLWQIYSWKKPEHRKRRYPY